MEEFFVIYDLKDNIVAYIDNIDELLKFTKVRKDNLYSRLKIKDFYCYLSDNTYHKIYRFFS